jgi:Flp pilus assembly pilin Flp
VALNRSNRTTYGVTPLVLPPFIARHRPSEEADGEDESEKDNMNALKETGSSLVEYVLLLSLIAVACIGALQLTGNKSSSKLSSAGSSVQGIASAPLTPAPTSTTTTTTTVCNGNNGNGNGNGNCPKGK